MHAIAHIHLQRCFEFADLQASECCELCHNLMQLVPTKSFVNKVFVLSGGNSGMGFDTAQYLASEGAKVYITGRNQEAVAKAAQEIGNNAVGVVADTASISDSVKLADLIAANGDKLDG